MDYRALLRKYVAHVYKEEGSMFISEIDSALAKFTAEEHAALAEIKVEVEVEIAGIRTPIIDGRYRPEMPTLRHVWMPVRYTPISARDHPPRGGVQRDIDPQECDTEAECRRVCETLNDEALAREKAKSRVGT